MEYEKLLEEANHEGIYVIENADFKSKSEGLINGDVIGINRKIRSMTKRACVLAEELGHYHTAVGDILDQSSTNNRKQEVKGRIWAYNKMVGLHGIIRAYEKGCYDKTSMADYLNVTEEFLLDALDCYKSKYGSYKELDNYVIFFQPLGVLELYK